MTEFKSQESIEGDPTVITMQATPVPQSAPNAVGNFEARIGNDIIMCSDFRISESGGCITLFTHEGKRVCIGGNSATVIIREL